MSYELTGNIYKIEDTQIISDTFSKREICVTIPGDYEQVISLELHKDKCAQADTLNIGDKVTCHFNLNGRTWTKPETGVERVFNTLAIWKIDKLAPAVTAQTEQPVAPSLTPEPDSDIPF